MADETTALDAVTEAAGSAAGEDSADSASSAEDTEQSGLGESTDDSPTTLASDDGPALDSDGPIPVARHKSILDKARAETAAAQRALTEYQQRTGWAEGLNQRTWQQTQQQIRALQENPIDFYERLGRELKAHPHLGPQLKAPSEVPKPSLKSEDGKAAYTAEEAQALVNHFVNQAQVQTGQQVQQLQRQLDGLQQSDRKRSMQAESQVYTRDLMAEMSARPGFVDNQGAIEKAFAAIPKTDVARDGVRASLYRAYLDVFTKSIGPSQAKKTEQRVLTTLKKKAGATAVDPSDTPTSDRTGPKNVRELAKHLESLASA
jgi:hypothetical protein